MRLRNIGVLLGVILAGAALATASWASTSPVRKPVVPIVTDIGPNGSPVGHSRRATPGRQGRSLQASGCREIDIAKDGRSFLFNSLVYRWHHSNRCAP